MLRPLLLKGRFWGKTAVAPSSRAVGADEALLKEYRASRSPAAFAELAARHSAMVYRIGCRVLSNSHDAEDVAQAVFLALARQPDAVKHTVVGWLHETARGKAIDLLRSRARRAGREEEAARRMPTDTPMPDIDLREELDAALSQLPGPLQEAVVLRYLEGRSVEEAARTAGCPQGTLGWRAMKGLEELRTILSRRGVVSTALLLGFLAQESHAGTPPTLAAACQGAAGVPAAAGVALLGNLRLLLATAVVLALLGGVVVYYQVRPVAEAPAGPSVARKVRMVRYEYLGPRPTADGKVRHHYRYVLWVDNGSGTIITLKREVDYPQVFDSEAAAVEHFNLLAMLTSNENRRVAALPPNSRDRQPGSRYLQSMIDDGDD